MIVVNAVPHVSKQLLPMNIQDSYHSQRSLFENCLERGQDGKICLSFYAHFQESNSPAVWCNMGQIQVTFISKRDIWQFALRRTIKVSIQENLISNFFSLDLGLST